MPRSSAQMLSQAGLPPIRASITSAPRATTATWTGRNAQRARPARGAGPGSAGNRSASTARAPWPAAGGGCAADPAWLGARSSDADMAGTYHQAAPYLPGGAPGPHRDTGGLPGGRGAGALQFHGQDRVGAVAEDDRGDVQLLTGVGPQC